MTDRDKVLEWAYKLDKVRRDLPSISDTTLQHKVTKASDVVSTALAKLLRRIK